MMRPRTRINRHQRLRSHLLAMLQAILTHPLRIHRHRAALLDSERLRNHVLSVQRLQARVLRTARQLAAHAVLHIVARLLLELLSRRQHRPHNNHRHLQSGLLLRKRRLLNSPPLGSLLQP